MGNNNFGGLFWPLKDDSGNDIDWDTFYIPYIYKEIYLEGIYIDIFNTRKDLTVIDVGANLGIVTAYMRKYSKKIYAIEPANEFYTALQKNKEYNKWDNVETFKLAIADKDGKMTLNKNTNNRTCHSLTLNYNQGSEEVETMRMDTFFKKNNIDKVDFMKFDTEGAEEMILLSEGFKNVADKISAIMIEFHFPSFPKIVEYMLKLGYKARRYDSSAVIILFTK